MRQIIVPLYPARNEVSSLASVKFAPHKNLELRYMDQAISCSFRERGSTFWAALGRSNHFLGSGLLRGCDIPRRFMPLGDLRMDGLGVRLAGDVQVDVLDCSGQRLATLEDREEAHAEE